jgi:hypothetical protein
MKIDTEGHEDFVVDGAKTLLQNGQIKNALIEVHRQNFAKIVRQMDEYGYKTVRIVKDVNMVMSYVKNANVYPFEDDLEGILKFFEIHKEYHFDILFSR